MGNTKRNRKKVSKGIKWASWFCYFREIQLASALPNAKEAEAEFEFEIFISFQSFSLMNCDGIANQCAISKAFFANSAKGKILSIW